jgi:hypothetical protein
MLARCSAALVKKPLRRLCPAYWLAIKPARAANFLMMRATL